mmetsp:Transcript_4111/g.11667  ORF Transcript_4111/g.11667 Transcript_4111/m.11667 type:complete len:214 (-) Transcript_4111:406-1047(-)
MQLYSPRPHVLLLLFFIPSTDLVTAGDGGDIRPALARGIPGGAAAAPAALPSALVLLATPLLLAETRPMPPPPSLLPLLPILSAPPPPSIPALLPLPARSGKVDEPSALPIRTMLLPPLLLVRRRRREADEDEEVSDQLALRPDTDVPLPKTLLLLLPRPPASASLHRPSNPSRSCFNDDNGADSDSSQFGRSSSPPPLLAVLANAEAAPSPP